MKGERNWNLEGKETAKRCVFYEMKDDREQRNTWIHSGIEQTFEVKEKKIRNFRLHDDDANEAQTGASIIIFFIVFEYALRRLLRCF